jgi:alpha-L-fucosidase 2
VGRELTLRERPAWNDAGWRRFKENVVLNDITLWSGSPQDANNYHAHKHLPEVQKLLLEGKNEEAQAIVNKEFICKGAGSGHGNGADVPFGSYQVLANLHLQFQYPGVDSTNLKYKNYQRQLTLNNAIASLSYTVNDVNYTREYLTSFGDDVNVIRISASKPGQLNFRITIDRPERYATKLNGNALEIAGQLKDGQGGNGMQYFGNVSARLTGGHLTAESNSLVVKNASEVILYISAKTDYKDPLFKQHALSFAKAALGKTFTAQKTSHITHYQKLFNRVSVNIGSNQFAYLPTNERLVQFQQDPKADTGLPVLFFQFGRYLLISSIRVGLLPPNLQGLWANQIQTPWNSDYHVDLNIQMCHWPVEVANLSELDLPLTQFVKELIPNGQRTAKAYYNADGWIAHVIVNVWNFTEPGESANWGSTKVGPGWLANNLWNHYLYTQDKKYLAEIYPIIKGAAQFYNSLLVDDPKTGWLVTSPSSSPENAYHLPSGQVSSIAMGPTIDNQIVRELFTNVIVASKSLNRDAQFRKMLTGRLQKVPPAGQIAKDGRIMEWLEDYKENRAVTSSHISLIRPLSRLVDYARENTCACRSK